ncbi:hypothetical protein I307_03815 [Cryptococcus deuterogattii 99/473]|uniref:Unplaced genomic scaffold supercont1.18, whole genome shotgun sequence n=1 Tax=Cryptococcus deuterogattii Ram5 TaxID=1296110 RepID=A0A0D0URK6_9TREE|nr:hypothetical protein I313_06197 [Cryptococcus deuterogattii Ram5]KIY56711.1 hypothetical protein I307_03815 [Cryptococcus deuterogattii 99/473]
MSLPTTLNHTLVPMPTRQHSDRAEALLTLSIALIDSALDILQHHVHTDEQLTRDSALLPGGTLGKHFRHVCRPYARTPLTSAQVIETFRAFLLPLYPVPTTPPHIPEINYDAIVPSSRRPIARSLDVCRAAMRQVAKDLSAWGESCRERGRARKAATNAHEEKRQSEKSKSMHNAGGERDGLVDEMERAVRVAAITPTKQEMGSTVGRELWYCSIHAIHHFSMLRTIAVYELVSSHPSPRREQKKQQG